MMTTTTSWRPNIYIIFFLKEINGKVLSTETLKNLKRLFYLRSDSYLEIGEIDGCKYLKRLAGWWIGPGKRRCGERYAANAGANAFAFVLGLFANFTVIGSDDPSGIVLCKCLIAFSASHRWSKRTKPTPFERPDDEDEFSNISNWSSTS